ncbi:hypothetical protein H5410_050748 [Solanum commersonii]|uniref:SWIM-type domain-containing protein n=1 Tax=Solanum commersonii TaxID=4109 RepID=A0A9J5WWB3_SOLCO|nr:hypothetical protein H5410_050748 [Solanum commersonii]
MGNQMLPAAKKIAKKKKIGGDSLYVENVTGDGNQFTVFGVGVTSNVNLLEKSCSCRKYDLVKIPCAHAMVALRSNHDNMYGMGIYEYSLLLYKVDAYLLAYVHSINNILPPLVDTKLGRKRRKRVKGIVKISRARYETNVRFVREPDTRDHMCEQQQILNKID